jgi:hypothetical protein
MITVSMPRCKMRRQRRAVKNAGALLVDFHIAGSGLNSAKTPVAPSMTVIDKVTKYDENTVLSRWVQRRRNTCGIC